MIELLVIAGLAGLVLSAVEASRRRALRQARLRAEAMLDELAAAACAALAASPDSSRRCGRAVERYDRASAEVAAARTRRELDMLVARHRLRQGAMRMVTRGLERTRDLLAEAVPARR